MLLNVIKRHDFTFQHTVILLPLPSGTQTLHSTWLTSRTYISNESKPNGDETSHPRQCY